MDKEKKQYLLGLVQNELFQANKRAIKSRGFAVDFADASLTQDCVIVSNKVLI